MALFFKALKESGHFKGTAIFKYSETIYSRLEVIKKRLSKDGITV